MEESESNPQLIFRSYRRHRRQSRWGTCSLFAPPVALLWCTFWYLMMNRPSLQNQGRAISTELIALAAGCALISLIGASLATAGMLDGYHKHGRAALGLAINCVLLVAVAAAFCLRVFSTSVA
jgi:hypothetical protein